MQQNPSNTPTHNRSLSGTASMLTNQFNDLTSNFSLKNSPINSSSSPAKNVSSFLSRASSLTTSVTSNVAGVAGRISSEIKNISSRSKVLLVIDDYQTDWSKYFKGKRICGDFDIKVEQAEFRDISTFSHSEFGTVCGIVSTEHGGHKISRQFKPDFVLIRQHVKDSQDDFRDVILGLKYGNIPAMNSIHSVYNFIDRPWVYSQLINIQKRLGKENFPLIEQTYYASYKEMLHNPPKFPCVIKIGHSHGGLGKLKVENIAHFQELLSVLACSNMYLTVEPYIDAKCDVHIQKIGNNYKAFMRKSISGSWKSNMGSAMLEKCLVTEKHRKWADEVSNLFGGLELLTIEVVETKTNEQFIYEVTGSQMTLMGETQEEDRRLISDLLTIKMQQALTCQSSSIPGRENFSQISGEDVTNMQMGTGQNYMPSESMQSTSKANPPQQSFLKRMGSISGSIGNSINNTLNSTGVGGIGAGRRGSNSSLDSTGSPNLANTSNPLGQQVTDTVDKTAQQIRGLFRRTSQTGNDEKTGEETDDTMKNLRKTFAGIFGDN